MLKANVDATIHFPSSFLSCIVRDNGGGVALMYYSMADISISEVAEVKAILLAMELLLH